MIEKFGRISFDSINMEITINIFLFALAFQQDK